MRKLQIVIDTNVVVAAQRSRRGASSKLLSLLGTDQFDAHISVPLAIEYEDVLLRQRQQLGLTQQDVADLVDALCTLAVQHDVYFLWRQHIRDAKDDHVLELAVVAQCDSIVTHNIRNFVGAESFGIGVIHPKGFLQRIGAIP